MIISEKSSGAEFNLKEPFDINSVKNSKLGFNKTAEDKNNHQYNESKIGEILFLVPPPQFVPSCICAGLWPQ